jgi:dTDP-L-rhamnose 4-epimerase
VLADGLGLDLEPEIVGQYRAGDIRHCYADPSIAQELLGFSSETSFEDGMRDLLDWLSGQEAVDRVDSALEALASRGLTR